MIVGAPRAELSACVFQFLHMASRTVYNLYSAVGLSDLIWCLLYDIIIYASDIQGARRCIAPRASAAHYILSSEPVHSAIALEAHAERKPIHIDSMMYSILRRQQYSYLQANNV